MSENTMNQQALEAAEKAVIKVLNDCVSSGIAWRPGTLALAHAALTAYAEATEERVVAHNSTNMTLTIEDVVFCAGEGDDISFPPKHELVVRKVGT